MMNSSELPKILYVDDEKINLELFQMAFNKKLTVVLADSGFKGLDIVEKDKGLQFIISDMKMPEMNGMEFIKKAKMIRDDLPCVILSGYQKDDEIIQGLNSGVILEYIVKPFNKEQMLQVIQKILIKP